MKVHFTLIRRVSPHYVDDFGTTLEDVLEPEQIAEIDAERISCAIKRERDKCKPSPSCQFCFRVPLSPEEGCPTPHKSRKGQYVLIGYVGCNKPRVGCIQVVEADSDTAALSQVLPFVEEHDAIDIDRVQNWSVAENVALCSVEL